jgi:hypothetical protein
MVVVDKVDDMVKEFSIARFLPGVGCGRRKYGSIPCVSI